MEHSARPDHGEETECTLAVVCPAPREVLARIASCRTIGEFRLAPAGSLRIHDRYLDTAERLLGRRGFALRIREIDGAQRLTLKGPSRTGEDGVQRRLEIEEDRTPSGVRRIAEALRAEGALPEAGAEGAGTVDAPFGRVDLKWIHTRRISRERLIAEDVSRNAVCELALDAVIFPAAGGDLRHFEVEVEAVAGGSAETVSRLAGLLAREHPELRPWPWSKLQTGTVLQAMARDGAIPAGRPGGALYDEIEARLRRGSFRALDGARP